MELGGLDRILQNTRGKSPLISNNLRDLSHLKRTKSLFWIGINVFVLDPQFRHWPSRTVNYKIDFASTRMSLLCTIELSAPVVEWMTKKTGNRGTLHTSWVTPKSYAGGEIKPPRWLKSNVRNGMLNCIQYKKLQSELHDIFSAHLHSGKETHTTYNGGAAFWRKFLCFLTKKSTGSQMTNFSTELRKLFW